MSQEVASIICAVCGEEQQLSLIKSELGCLYLNVQDKVWMKFCPSRMFVVCKECAKIEEIQIRD
jgi:hypothetical protein